VHNPGPTPSPSGSGDTEVDYGVGTALEGSGATHVAHATVAQATWPAETNIVYVTGTTKVKLSLQPQLLQIILQDAFEKVRFGLAFDHSFPSAKVLPAVVRKSLVEAAETRTFVDGRYNQSAACVHQRLLSDDDYEAKMARLVSNIASTVT
jgi:hypothetical protein